MTKQRHAQGIIWCTGELSWCELYSLNALQAGYIGDYTESSKGVIKGDTMSLDLDYSSYDLYVVLVARGLSL